jgi:hypothetical protein
VKCHGASLRGRVASRARLMEDRERGSIGGQPVDAPEEVWDPAYLRRVAPLTERAWTISHIESW